MNIIDKIKQKAKPKKIIFPEGEDERILKAVIKAEKLGYVKPIIMGNVKEIIKTAHKLKLDLSKIKLLEGNLEDAAEEVAKGEADAMIAGAVYTSAEVMKTSYYKIGLKEKTFSSFFIMEIGKEIKIFADAGAVPKPTAEQLADIAITTGKSVKKLLGIKPRIAMLSFSTKGSASEKFEEVKRVKDATKIAQKKAKEMYIDGEMQADTALREDVAKIKMKNLGEVAGRANILIFPCLSAGNIAYKLVQIYGKANAYGPILQGFKKPVSDLSRGATEEDIIGIIAIMSVMAE